MRAVGNADSELGIIATSKLNHSDKAKDKESRMEIRWHSTACVTGDVKQKSIILWRGQADVERCVVGEGRAPAEWKAWAP